VSTQTFNLVDSNPITFTPSIVYLNETLLTITVDRANIPTTEIYVSINVDSTSIFVGTISSTGTTLSSYITSSMKNSNNITVTVEPNTYNVVIWYADNSSPYGGYTINSTQTFDLVSPNVSSTLTLNDTMDSYYETQGVTYNIITKTVNSINYKLLIPNGGNSGNPHTTEALSYYLNYVVSKYIMSNDKQKYLRLIIQILNTITNLFNTCSSNVYNINSVYFPTWTFNSNGVGDTYVYDSVTLSTGSAADSNQEIMKSFLRLLIYDNNNGQSILKNYVAGGSNSLEPVLPLTTTQIMNVDRTVLGMNNIWQSQYEVNDSLNIVFHKAMFMWIYNLFSNGNYKAINSFNYSFAESPVNPTFTVAVNGIDNNCNGGNTSILDKGYIDYMNYSLFIYLIYYLNLYGNESIYTSTNPTLLNTIKIGTKFLFPNADSSYTMAPITQTKNALTLLIDNITATPTTMYNYWANSQDNNQVQVWRMSYQLCEFFILITQGDHFLNIVPNNNLISKVYNSGTITKMYTVMDNVIKADVKNLNNSSLSNQNLLYLDSAQLSYSINESGTVTSYIHQLSYIIYKNIHSFPYNRTNVSGMYFIENHTLNQYFGFENDSTFGNNLIKQANNWAQGIPASSSEFNNYWNLSSTSEWGQDPYFHFAIVILHMMNYRLYNA
jgi:hypothetical protein